MPNGKEILEELDFEQQIKKMSDRTLLEFTSRQVYETCVVLKEQRETVKSHNKRITSLESGSKKASALSGGASGAIAGIIIAVFEYFRAR